VRGYSSSVVAVALLVLLGLAGSPAEARGVLEPIVPVPSAGNVAVARLAIQSSATASSQPPRLRIANPSALPAGALAVATVAPAAAGRFNATIAVVRPAAATAPGQPSGPSRALIIQLPAGSRLVSGPQWVNDVLYTNRRPNFPLSSRGVTSVLAGQAFSRLPASTLTTDAQLLALDRPIPMAHARVFGLQYVAVAFPSRAGPRLTVSVGLAGLTQVNGIELRFPAGLNVASVEGPVGTEGLLLGNAVQLISSGRSFREGSLYTFTLHLSRPPAARDVVTVRASEHYFESALPFSERFGLG
jgi:hypothetical protein